MCAIWTDHEWGSARFLEVGKHPSMGRYQRVLVRCEYCKQETTETHWLDLPMRAMRVSETEGRNV